MSLLKFGEFIKIPDHLDQEYEGIVVDVNDPLKLDRVRVVIAGMLESDDHTKLPWCTTKHQLSILGRVCIVPEVNDKVMVTFPYGVPYIPVYDSYLVSNFSSLAITDPTLADVDYPTTQVAKDSTGSYLQVNKTKKTFDYKHSSNFRIRISEQGKCQIDIPDNWQVEITKETTIHGQQVIRINSDDHIELNGNILDSARVTDETVHLCPIIGGPVTGVIKKGNNRVKQNL